MDDKERSFKDMQMQKRASDIADGKEQSDYHQDGYTNLLNKYGTAQDNSMAYTYEQEPITPDLELVRLYESNGLFTKIIDRPAEEAVKHGFDIDYGDEDIAEYVDERLDELDFEDKFATAEKWARLYGGSIIVMLCDDGKGLEEPLDWKNVRSVEELRVFERAIVQEDYTSLYNFHFKDSIRQNKPFGQPEYYHIFSMYGYFTVHYSRCLIFRNGRLPEHTTNSIYKYWGIPEYVKIKRALRECITSHEDGVKLLERSVQAIYKMKNLANLLSTEDGEDKVLQRLQVIDMARGILNSMAIDSEGEDYDFKTLQMSGVKDVIDATCNMLSAVTNIPQTILFGRSPAGMNSTGDSDLENFYNMVENIQKQNMKANARTLINLILKQGQLEGKIKEVPMYKLKFAPLWSMSESEQASIAQMKVSAEQTKAAIAQTYIEAGVLDPSEVRKSLAKEGEFDIEEVITEDDLDLPEDTFPPKEEERAAQSKEEAEDAPKPKEEPKAPEAPIIKSKKTDAAEPQAAAVIVIKDGKILVGDRRNAEGICGPGGHREAGETTRDTALREAQEEFDIVPLNILPIGNCNASAGQYRDSVVYLTDEYTGTPEADGVEMLNARWMSLRELEGQKLFPPFEDSLKILKESLAKYLTQSNGSSTVTSENNDGAPKGNQNAAGPHKMKSGGSDDRKPKYTPADYAAAKRYTKAVKGTVATNGVTVKKVSVHAGQMMQKRNISTDDLYNDLTQPDSTYPGNQKHKDATCFQRGMDRIVLSKDGTVITTVDLEDDE